jgi:thiosulfate reductase/polysulfide reductase chain A
LPDQKKTLEAIQHLELMVVVDTMPMEITGYADVVLPECTYLERYDMVRTSPHREPNLALRMPALPPKYDTKPGWWMVKQLAEKMDLGEYFGWNNIEELLDWQLKQVGSSLEEMKRIGVRPMPRQYGGLYYTEGEEIEFNTNTGKIELFSTELQAEGFDPLPVYTAHETPPPGFYRLNYGRAPMHTFSRTANNPHLTDLMPENDLWVNPRVAREWGLKTGQYIWLENQDGMVSSHSDPGADHRAHPLGFYLHGARLWAYRSEPQPGRRQRSQRQRDDHQGPRGSHHGRHRHAGQFHHFHVGKT